MLSVRFICISLSVVVFLLDFVPRASACSKVEVSGSPSVSGRKKVKTPTMKDRIPTMSYITEINRHDVKYFFKTQI